MPPKSDQRTCIYCSELKTFIRGSGGDFNKEHVVPHSFASVKDSLTLVGSVCEQCNKYFGEKLDPILARCTAEAVQRYLEKQKPADRIHELDSNRIKLKLQNSPDSIPNSLLLGLTNEDGVIKQGPINQICFINKITDEWQCFSEADFERFQEQDYPELVVKNFKIFGPKSKIDAFRDKLRLRWPKLKIEGEIPKVKLDSMASVLYGSVELRSIAKIAFNYLCHVTEEHPLIIRSSNFDECRKYIRTGECASYQVVTPREETILASDTVNLRQTNGHLVTVEAIQKPDGTKKVISLVSLFNYLTWEVTLSNSFQDNSAVPICSIHHWDIEEKICRSGLAAKK